MDVAAVASLAFVASITPGPNNLMLWSSGLNYGVRETLPHLAGVNIGFSVLLFIVAVGLGTLFDRWPALQIGLAVAGGGYLLYLAYRIFNTKTVGEVDSAGRPMTFVEAALFQWVNPKAWVMSTTAVSTGIAAGAPLLAAAGALTALFAIVNLPCITAWALSGSFASRFLNDAGRVRTANRVLGVMLVATVGLIVT